MSGASPQTSAIVGVNKELKAYESAVIQVKYRDVSGTNTGNDVLTSSNLKIDLSSGYDEQILTGSVKFTMGSDQYLDRSGTLYRAVDPVTNSGISSGLIQYGTGVCEIEGWTPDTDNTVQLKSLTTTTDLPPVNKLCFRTPMIPIRVQSLTVVATSLEYGQLTLTADEYGKIETSRAHGSVNYENGLVNIDF